MNKEKWQDRFGWEEKENELKRLKINKREYIRQRDSKRRFLEELEGFDLVTERG